MEVQGKYQSKKKGKLRRCTINCSRESVRVFVDEVDGKPKMKAKFHKSIGIFCISLPSPAMIRPLFMSTYYKKNKREDSPEPRNNNEANDYSIQSNP